MDFARMTSVSREREHLRFVEDAAAHFAAHPEHFTYGNDFPKPGCLLALRWGLGNDCVLVVKTDEDFAPAIYQQAIR